MLYSLEPERLFHKSALYKICRTTAQTCLTHQSRVRDKPAFQIAATYSLSLRAKQGKYTSLGGKKIKVKGGG